MCSGTSTNITGLGGVFVPGKISSIEWPLISGSMEMAVIVVDLIVVTSSVSSGTGTPVQIYIYIYIIRRIINARKLYSIYIKYIEFIARCNNIL